MDEVAQHAEVQDQILTVNAAVVQWQAVFLSRETCRACASVTESADRSNAVGDAAGVSRSHSSSALEQRAERKERECPLMDRSAR
jgi:predicted ATPase